MRHKLLQHPACKGAAIPHLPLTVAGLTGFGRVNAEQPHPLASQVQRIAVNHPHDRAGQVRRNDSVRVPRLQGKACHQPGQGQNEKRTKIQHAPLFLPKAGKARRMLTFR